MLVSGIALDCDSPAGNSTMQSISASFRAALVNDNRGLCLRIEKSNRSVSSSINRNRSV